MGSVAERVVRMAPCPVLTVRHPEHEFLAPDALVAVARAWAMRTIPVPPPAIERSGHTRLVLRDRTVASLRTGGPWRVAPLFPRPLGAVAARRARGVL